MGTFKGKIIDKWNAINKFYQTKTKENSFVG